MSTNNESAAQNEFNADDMDVSGGDNVGGPRHPFLAMGPEGGSGCKYLLELVQTRWWRQPVTNGKKGAKGPQRFNFIVRVLGSDGDGATKPDTLCALLFAEPTGGHEFYLRDAKACVEALTGGKLTDPVITNTLFNPKHKNTFIGAKFGVQVSRNAGNAQYPVYTFEPVGTATTEETAADLG